MDIEQIFAAEVFSARGKPNASDIVAGALCDLWQFDYGTAKKVAPKYTYWIGDEPFPRDDIDWGNVVAL